MYIDRHANKKHDMPYEKSRVVKPRVIIGEVLSEVASLHVTVQCGVEHGKEHGRNGCRLPPHSRGVEECPTSEGIMYHRDKQPFGIAGLCSSQ